MLNACYNAKKFNKKIETLDKTKIPLILYISLENHQTITFSRLVRLSLNKTKKDIKQYDPQILAEEVYKELNSGEFHGAETQIKFIYRRSKTISTDDLYSIIEEEENNGFEVVMMGVDYLGTIRSSASLDDRRLEMDQASRDLADLSVAKNIFVLTGGQLNRSAYSTGKPDMTMIAEALSITNHVDNVWILNVDKDIETNRKYLEIYNKKDRSNEEEKVIDEDFELEEFYPDNPFKLIPSQFCSNLCILEPSTTKNSFASKNAEREKTSYSKNKKKALMANEYETEREAKKLQEKIKKRKQTEF
jgi:replicative DNA helicase